MSSVLTGKNDETPEDVVESIADRVEAVIKDYRKGKVKSDAIDIIEGSTIALTLPIIAYQLSRIADALDRD